MHDIKLSRSSHVQSHPSQASRQIPFGILFCRSNYLPIDQYRFADDSHEPSSALDQSTPPHACLIVQLNRLIPLLHHQPRCSIAQVNLRELATSHVAFPLHLPKPVPVEVKSDNPLQLRMQRHSSSIVQYYFVPFNINILAPIYSHVAHERR